MKKKIKYIVPSLITFLILFIIFYIHNLYPLGNNSIVQVDADYQFIPVLYRIYDFLHGNGSIVYDDLGFGNNIYISMIIQGSIFSPISFLLYFTERSNIVNYFNIILMVKFCLLSLTTYIYINCNFKVNEFYKILFSILYTFSGWMLLNYFNIMWIDSVILFPLIILYLNKLLNDEKYLGYIITLSFSLIISYYISYFILLFILFYSFGYIFLYMKKKKLKRIIFKLGISTFISILISSFSLLPALYQTFISSRFSSVSSSGIFSNFMNKSLFLMMSTFFVVLFIKLLFKYKNDKRNVYFYLLLLILFGIGIVIEPINLGIHMGSYWCFPYRYSFITLFILMIGSLYYINKYDINGYMNYELIRFVLFLILCMIVGYCGYLFYDEIIDSQIILSFDNFNVYKKILIVFFLMCFLIIISFSFNNKYLKYMSISIVCLLQIFVFSSWSMYYSDGYYLSNNANEINNNMDIISDKLKRYKMGYNYYTPDYGFIYRVNTLDNWLHIIPEGELEVYDKLGYVVTDTSVKSIGGTVISDFIFNVKYLIDNKNNSDTMYRLIDEYDDYNLYEYNYNNDFGIVYNKEKDDLLVMEGLELHNKIYRDLFNKEDDIVKIDDYIFDGNSGVVSLNYNINELGYVYLYINDFIDELFVNNNKINFIDDNSYIIDLGMYDSDINIKLLFSNLDEINFSVGFVRYDDVMRLDGGVDNVSKINNEYLINVNNNMDNGYLFLPINKIDGLRAFVNGNEVDVDIYLNNFVSIKLDKGYNEVKVRYDMPLFKLGIVFSVLGIVCLIFFNKITLHDLILNVVYYIFIFVCLFFYLYIYGYSIIKYYR